jgi:hypothetical protein
MIIEQGINSKDWKDVSSKIKRANLQQLTFLVETIKTEILKRRGL